MTRRQVWQDFLDWLRPVDEGASAARRVSNSAEVSEFDLAAPVPVALAGGALAEAGTSTGPEWAGERAHQSFLDDEVAPEIDEDELLEFLAADHDPAFADPAFKEELRDELWALVQERAGMRPKSH